jgi:dephospho-CoA kinase
MFLLVITGGIGSGKSTAAEYFRQAGAFVIDLDDVASRVLSPGSATLDAVAAAFGPDVLLADGRLDRPALARAAFASKATAQRLNALVHPAVTSELSRKLSELRSARKAPALVVVEVPLLAEAPAIADVADVVLAIVAPQEVRVQRTVASGRAEPDARRRLAVQASDAERAALADVVIVNDGDRESFLARLDRFRREHVVLGGER